MLKCCSLPVSDISRRGAGYPGAGEVRVRLESELPPSPSLHTILQSAYYNYAFLSGCRERGTGHPSTGNLIKCVPVGGLDMSEEKGEEKEVQQGKGTERNGAIWYFRNLSKRLNEELRGKRGRRTVKEYS